MRNLLAVFMLFVVFISHAAKLHAAELTDLFQAQVPANQSQAQWQRAALSIVLVKLTGSEQVLANPAVIAELKNSAAYVKQFQTVQVDAKSLMLVHLDEGKVTSLLQREQIPMLGSRRPDQLLWFTEKLQEKPAFVLDNQHPVRKALLEQAAQLGLSLVFPLYDVDDLALINEQTLWAGEWSVIQTASARYQGATAHNLLFDQFTDASGTVTFRLTAQYWLDGQMQSREYTNLDARQLAIEFCRQLAAELAAKYALSVNPSQTGESTLTLTIGSVKSLKDLVALQQIFGSLLSVKSYSLQEFQQGTAVFALELAATEDAFYRNISLVKQLQPQEMLPVDNIKSVDPETLAAEAQFEAQLEADARSEPEVAQTAGLPSAGDTQAANVNDLETPVDETQSGLTEPTPSIAEPISSGMVKTNHFIFVGH